MKSIRILSAVVVAWTCFASACSSEPQSDPPQGGSGGSAGIAGHAQGGSATGGSAGIAGHAQGGSAAGGIAGTAGHAQGGSATGGSAGTAGQAQAGSAPGGSAGAPSDTFGLAVIPDTQAETNIVSNKVFIDRTTWLVANKDKFELRYVLHTGDMVNWGWLDPAQFTRAKAAMDILANAGIPYNLSIGNHDTAAVGWNGVAGSTGYGGSAYQDNPECPSKLGADACHSWLLVRNTTAFNATFPLSSIKNVGGAFEADKIDNNWTTFESSNSKWLVLTLELWQRKEVVAWAKDVVATHPTYNVIIQTHNYLNGDGSIGTSNGGYGATAPSYLRDEIVSQYPNVKMVCSGHVGTFTSRTDTYTGNTVVSFLGNALTNSDDPVRVVTINTKTGAVTSTVYDPIVGKTLDPTTDTISVVH